MAKYVFQNPDGKFQIVEVFGFVPPTAVCQAPDDIDMKDGPYLVIQGDGTLAVDENVKAAALDAAYEQRLIKQEIEDAKGYLASTDWYIIREVDTGTPCPTNIKQARQAAREKL